MIDSLSRTPIAVYAGLLLALAAVAVVVGCGGGGDSDEPGSTAAGASPTASQSQPPGTKATSKAAHSSSGERPRSAQAIERAREKAARAHRRAVAIRRGAERDCPAGITVAQCESLAEEVAEKEGSSAPPMEEPNDCLKVMSRAQCEALLAAQQAAAESENQPVSVERCLEDPTPRCREVLESMAEDQHVTPQSADK